MTLRQAVLNERNEVHPLHFGGVLKFIDQNVIVARSNSFENKRRIIASYNGVDHAVKVGEQHGIFLCSYLSCILVHPINKAEGVHVVRNLPYQRHALEGLLRNQFRQFIHDFVSAPFYRCKTGTNISRCFVMKPRSCVEEFFQSFGSFG